MMTLWTEEEGVDIPVKVVQELKEGLYEVVDAIDKIICCGNALDTSYVPLVN